MDWIFKSIKTKLTLGVIFIVVILLAVLLLLSYTSLTRYSLNNALELSNIILNETDSKISRFFLELNYLTMSLKNNSTVYNVKTDLMKELFITTVEARNEYLRAIYLGTSNGEMYEWGMGDGFVDNTPTFPEGYDPRLRPWYRAAMEANGFAISKPYIYASINALGITCGVPVYDKENRFIGVLGLDIILKGLSNMINNLQVQKQGSVVLLNQNFEILADQFNAYTENITRLKKFTNQDLLTGDSGYFINTSKEGKMLTFYKIIESTDWILLVSIPYSEIMEFSNQTLTIILLSEFFLMFILTVVLTILLHKIITEPMSRMIGVMKAIEYGSVDARIVVKGEDEFSILGKMFNQLEDIRQKYTTSMEKEIENRTREITSLQNENMRLRIIEEKERIFGNLHDSLGARLTNIFISNSVAKKVLLNNQELLKDMHERIDKNTRQGIRDLKEIIFGPATGDRVII
ncbi:MAG: Cache 3/Cache 2 fusion domain-containing protein, partial [Spirochaetales bacterium]|nr:Cache 3/Cache 2 fusion domain-containing protein [Spirochaetales bacterium]